MSTAQLFFSRIVDTISHLICHLSGRRHQTLLAICCLSLRTAHSFAPISMAGVQQTHYTYSTSSKQEQTMTTVRRSARLQKLSTAAGMDASDDLPVKEKKGAVKATLAAPKKKAAPKRKASTVRATGTTTKKSTTKNKAKNKDEAEKDAPAVKKKKTKKAVETLPRTREQELLLEDDSALSYILGVDEAGRGPLAGPVVAAAVLSTAATVEGICDSKKLTKEEVRDELYRTLTTSPNLRYAVAVVDAKTIDDINILQATYEAMRMAAHGVLGMTNVRYESTISTEHEGCYVVAGATDEGGQSINGDAPPLDPTKVFALIDGNRLPPKLGMEGETMVKGDGREYLIGAASILAKVSRDSLMHEYHEKYPHYLLNQHKGYGTAKHMDLIFEHGAIPIHRRTFAPLKHMDLDEDGRIVGEKKDEKGKKKAGKK